MANNIEMISDLTKSILNDYKLTFKNKKTSAEYYYIINSLCRYCGKDYLQADYNDFKNYFDSLKTEVEMGTLSPKTVNMRHSVLTNFSAYIVGCADTYGIKNFANYMTKIPKPGASLIVKTESIPTLQQLDKIYTIAKETDPLMYAVISLVNKCALTVEQICDLKIDNFLLDAELNYGILIPYQYRSDRYIKLTDDTLNIINYYVENIRSCKVSEPYLFCNYIGGQLTPRVLQKRMKKINLKAAAEEGWNFTLQDIRNLSITLMLKGGADNNMLSEYIGIRPKWIQRFNKVVTEYTLAACDYNNITVNSHRQDIHIPA